MPSSPEPSAARTSPLDPQPGILLWRQRQWWGWLVGRMYVLGISSGSVAKGHEDGWIHRPFFRGDRPYILGFRKFSWGRWPLAHRLRYGHWPVTVHLGMCGVCAPWPCCGSTGYGHEEDCDGNV